MRDTRHLGLPPRPCSIQSRSAIAKLKQVPQIATKHAAKPRVLKLPTYKVRAIVTERLTSRWFRL